MLIVTGITGRSGKCFLRELITHQYGEPIRCIVRKNSDTALIDNSGLKIEKVVGDLGDQAFMEAALCGADTVLHIASISYSVNVMTAAIRNQVKQAIFVHTTGIYSKYKSASAKYKEVEATLGRLIAESSAPIDLIYLRPTMIYGSIADGNMIQFIKMIDRCRTFAVIDGGKSLLQPVNACDLGKAYYQLLSKPEIRKGDYILSGEKPITMLEMFKLISEYLHKDTKFINVPLWAGVSLAKGLKALTRGKIDFIEKVQRMSEDRSFSHDAASADFGYAPMPFAEGLKIEVEEYMQRR